MHVNSCNFSSIWSRVNMIFSLEKRFVNTGEKKFLPTSIKKINEWKAQRNKASGLAFRGGGLFYINKLLIEREMMGLKNS